MKLTLAVDVGLYLRAVQMCSIANTTHSLFRLHLVEQISWAIVQGGGLWSTTFVSIYQNVCIGL